MQPVTHYHERTWKIWSASKHSNAAGKHNKEDQARPAIGSEGTCTSKHILYIITLCNQVSTRIPELHNPNCCTPAMLAPHQTYNSHSHPKRG